MTGSLTSKNGVLILDRGRGNLLFKSHQKRKYNNQQLLLLTLGNMEMNIYSRNLKDNFFGYCLNTAEALRWFHIFVVFAQCKFCWFYCRAK